MFKVLLHHLLRHVPGTLCPVPDAPEMPSPIPFLQMGIFFLKQSRCSPFQPFEQITDRQHRRVFHVHVDVILAHYALQNSDVFSATYLDQQLAASRLHLADKHMISVFRRPDDVHGQSRDRVASRAAASHFPTLPVASGPTHRLKDLHQSAWLTTSVLRQ